MTMSMIELAAASGVTVVAAKARLERLGVLSSSCYKRGRAWVIGDDALEAYREAYGRGGGTPAPGPAPSVATEPNGVSDEALVDELKGEVAYLRDRLESREGLFEAQLRVKDGQLARKDDQIDALLGGRADEWDETDAPEDEGRLVKAARAMEEEAAKAGLKDWKVDAVRARVIMCVWLGTKKRRGEE